MALSFANDRDILKGIDDPMHGTPPSLGTGHYLRGEGATKWENCGSETFSAPLKTG